MAYWTYRGQRGENFRPNSDAIHNAYMTNFDYDDYGSSYDKMIRQQTGRSISETIAMQYDGYGESHYQFN